MAFERIKNKRGWPRIPGARRSRCSSTLTPYNGTCAGSPHGFSSLSFVRDAAAFYLFAVVGGGGGWRGGASKFIAGLRPLTTHTFRKGGVL